MRVFCRLGFHRWYPTVFYTVRGYRWGERRCARCGRSEEFVTDDLGAGSVAS